MILSNKVLKDLLAANKDLNLVVSSDKLWLTDKKNSVVVEYNRSMTDLLKGIDKSRYEHFKTMAPLEVGKRKLFKAPKVSFEHMAYKTFLGKQKVTPPKNKNIPPSVRELFNTKGSKQKRAFTARELTGAAPGTIVNDFMAKYYSGKGPYSKLPLTKAWGKYSKKYKVNAGSVSMDQNFVKVLQKIDKEVQGRATPSTDRIAKTLQGGGTVKTLKADVSLANDYGTSKPVVMMQKVLDTTDKYIMFSGKQMSEENAARLGLMLKEHYKLDKPVSIVTPKGVTSVIPKDGSVSVNGFNRPNSSIGRVTQEEMLSRYVDLPKGPQRTTTIAATHKAYVNEQKRLKPHATETITSMISDMAGDMSPSEVRAFLKDTSIKDFKKLTGGLDIPRRNTIKNYNYDDDMKLNKFLKANSSYDRAIAPAVAVQDDMLNKEFAKTARNIKRRSRALGVEIPDIVDDLDNIAGDDPKKRLKTLNKIDSTLAYTMKTGKGRDAIKLNRERSNGGLARVDYRQFIENMKSKEGVERLRNQNYFSAGLDNPMVNLEGRLQSQHINSIVHEMIRDAKAGRPGRYDVDALVEVGKLLPRKELKNIEKTFGSMIGGKEHLMAARHGGMDNVLKVFNMLEDDVETPLLNKFGGVNDIAEAKKLIKQDRIRKVKDKEYQASAQSFASGDTYLGDDYDALEADVALKRLMEEKKSQVAAIKNYDLKTASGDTKGLTDPRDGFDKNALYNMTDADLANQAGVIKVPNAGVQREALDLNVLGRKLKDYKGAITGKKLDFNTYKEMVQTAKDLGFSESKSKVRKQRRDSLVPRDVYNYLNNYHEAAFAEAYPGLKTIKGRVQVNLTTPLFRDVARQDKTSFKNLGGKDIPGLVKFMGERKGEWSGLVNHFHDDSYGKYGLVFDDHDKIAAKKQFIQQQLGQIVGTRPGAITADQVKQLSSIYGSSPLMTTADERAYNLLANNQVTHPKTGEKYLNLGVSRKELIQGLLAPYNMEAFNAAPGEGIYAGKKTFTAPSQTFMSYYDEFSNKARRDKTLTKARKDFAVNYVKEQGLTKEFQTRGGRKALPMDEMFDELLVAQGKSQRFINDQVAPLYGSTNNAKPLDTISEKLTNKLNKLGTLAYEAAERKDWQTYNAHNAAIKSLGSSFGSKSFSNTSIKFAEELMADPDKALNSKIASASRKYYTNEALKLVEGREVSGGKPILPQGGQELNLLALEESRIRAEKLKQKVLELDKLGYSKPVSTLAQYIENSGLNKNVDPQNKATTEAGKIIKSSLESRADRQRGANVPYFTSGSGNSLQFYNSLDNLIKDTDIGSLSEKQRNRYLGAIDRIGSKKFNVISDLKRLGRIDNPIAKVKKKSLAEPMFDDYIYDEVKQPGFPYPKRVRNFRSEEIRDKGRINRLRYPLKFSTGGKVPGDGHRDEVPALLTKGEVVVDKKTSKALGIKNNKDYRRFKQAARQGKLGMFASGGVIDDEFTYKARPYDPSRGFEQGAWGMQEKGRVIQNLTLDLSKAKNINVDFGMSNKQIGKHLSMADVFEETLGADTISKAKTNLAGRALGGISLSSDELLNLRKVGSSASSLKAKNLDIKLLEKIGSLDFEALDSAVSVLDGLKSSSSEIADIKKGLTSAVGQSANIGTTTTAPGTKLNKFAKSMIQVEEYSKTLGEVFNTDKGYFKELAKMNPEKAVASLTNTLKAIDFNKLDVPTASASTAQLKTRENALSALDSLLKDDAFVRLGEQKSGVQDTRAKVNRARNLKESAESRVSNFGALMAQNTAFMGSYAVIGGVQAGIGSATKFFADFDNSMKNLQAITAETSDGLNVMSDAVKQVSTETKFSALEIADAATILGQAGFSAIDVSKSLEGVVQLATATGSKLEDATQVLTSTLTIWDKSVTDSKKYSNQFTAAINQSKLDIEALTGAIQYTGNIAAAANIPIADVLTMTSLLKDAGIKRSSTLGTGQRLLYGDFAAPSKKFIASLETVGISLQEFNTAFEDRGVYGALKLMKEAGYGLAQASRGMEVREKAIYAAAINQLDKFDIFRSNITGTDAAFIANKVQMEGIGNKFQNMLNSWQINLNENFEDNKGITRTVLDALTIDIKKRKPEDNTGVKGYTLEERYLPTRDANLGVGTALLAGGAGLAAYSYGRPMVKGYTAAALGRQPSFSPYGDTNAVRPQGTPRTLSRMDKVLISLDKKLGAKVAGGALAGAGVGLAGGVAALGAEEGRKGAAFVDTTVSGLALLAGGSIIEGMSKSLKDLGQDKYAPRTSGMRGAINKLGVGMLLMQLDEALVRPEAEKGTTAGYIGRAVEGGIGGAVLGGTYGGVYGAAGGALAGAGLGIGAAYLGKVEPPSIDLAVAFSSLVNDSKALSSELVAISKTAKSFSDLSNFALRPADDAGDAEKLAKFRAVVTESEGLNDEIKGIEAALVSYSKDFQGFNFGSALRGTAPEDVLQNKFKTQVFQADGTNIRATIVDFEGDAVDAMAMSLNSARVAASEARTARGGVDEGMFNQLVGKTLTSFTEALETTDGTFADFKAEVLGKGVNPIFELAKNSPAATINNQDLIKKTMNSYFDEATRVLESKKGVFSSESENAAITGQINKLSILRDSSLAKFNANLETAGYNADSPQAAVQIAKAQVLQEQKNLGPGTSLQAGFESFLESRAGKITQESYGNLSRQYTPVNAMVNRLTDGLNKLDKVDEAGINMARKLSIAGARTLRQDIMEFGPTIALATTEGAKALSEVFKDLEGTIRPLITKGGKDLKGKSTSSILNAGTDQSIVNRELIGKYVAQGDRPHAFKDAITEKQLVVNTKGLVTINNLGNEAATSAIAESSKGLLGSYLGALETSTKIFDQFSSFNTREDAIASGDINFVKMFDSLATTVDKAGLVNVEAFRTLADMEYGTAGNLTGQQADAFFNEVQQSKFNTSRRQSIDSLNLQIDQSRAKLERGYEFQKGEFDIRTGAQLAQMERGRNKQEEDIRIKAQRQVVDLALKVTESQQDIGQRYNRQVDKLDRSFGIQKRNIGTNYSRGIEDIGIKRDRGYEDIDTSFTRGMEDLAISLDRGMESIAINQGRAVNDLYRNVSRSFEDLDLKESRGEEDISIYAERAREALADKEGDATEDISKRLLRGLEDIEIARTRGLEDIATMNERSITKILLQQDRSLEDLNKSIARGMEDLQISYDRGLEDIDLNKARSTEDALTNFNDNIAAINLNLQRNIDSIERSRQDTIDAFDRSLTRPQVVSIDPKALGVIANQLGDVSLALDAHKAALTANTTAVMQNNALQQTQENIVKAAYTDAYKKVGGEVYNEDGTVNDAFTTAYETYMDKNSGGLIDAVLNNAINSAFAGTGFDISTALSSAGYIADQVSAPSPGVTMATAVAGSGLTEDELAASLYGVKADEVRVTTDAGVILEAQGGMEGALFDLETAMIGLDIKLREAGIAFNQSIVDATINLDNTMRDIETAYTRSLEDLSTNFARGVENLELSFARGLQDISTATSRAFTDLGTSIAYALEDLDTKLARAAEDLELAVKRATEDLTTSLDRAATDLETKIKHAGEDLALRISRGAEDINRSFARGMEDIAIRSGRAAEDLQRSINQAAEDLETKTRRAAEDLEKALDRTTQDLGLSSARALEDAVNNFDDSITEAGFEIEYALKDVADMSRRSQERIDLNLERAISDMLGNYAFNMNEFEESIRLAQEAMQRGFMNASNEITNDYSDRIASMDLQIAQMKENTLNGLIDWAQRLNDGIQTQLDNQVWDSTKLKASLETSFDTALQQLKVDGSEITKAVGVAFKTAFQGEGMKRITELLNANVTTILKTGFKVLDKPIDETMKALSGALDKSFQENLAKTMGENVTVMTEGALALTESTRQVGVAWTETNKQIEIFDDTAYKSDQMAKKLATAGLNLTDAAKKGTDASTEVGMFATSMNVTAGILLSAAPNLEKGGEDTVEASAEVARAGTSLLGGSVALSGGANAMQGVATALPAVGSAIETAARNAIESINRAVAAAQAAAQQTSAPGYRTGGLIPGYGGGDIVPAWLEPGEYIVRKEIVRELGAQKFHEINSGGDNIEAATVSQTTPQRLPTAAGPGINVQVGVQAGGSVEVIKDNIELIADGVRKVFEEYS